MINKTNAKLFQVQSQIPSKLKNDPLGPSPSVQEAPAADSQQSQSDQTTTQQVRIGRGLAPTAQQSSESAGGVLKAQIGARAARPRGRGRRTGVLREPNAAQLLRSMKNPEALKDVLALQAPLQQALQN